MTYIRPLSLDEALSALAREPRRVVCGGTDCYAQADHVPARWNWLDISRIPSLRGVSTDGGVIRIGAATPWDEIARAGHLPAALRQAAAQVGSRQIQRAATIGGNLCNAAPAADGMPPLLALGAQVEISGVDGVRVMPLSDFVLGRRRTALRPGELLKAIRFAALDVNETSTFHKFGNREGMTIAVVSAAVRLRFSPDGQVAAAAVVLGSASEVPVHAVGIERALVGCRPAAFATVCEQTPIPEIRPIDDLRGSAAFRTHLARMVVTRACAQLGEEAMDVERID